MSNASEALFAPLQLKSGQVLRNRIAKAAMEEGMAGKAQLPDERLITLYRQWGAGGTGLLITGNVMVHAEAMTGPGGVVLDADSPLEPFAAWARAGKDDGAAMWMQISHPGRQVQANMPGVVWGPSDVAVELGRHSKRFGQPVAMTAEQIADTVTRFATTARRAEQAGFDGVEVHAAHGYLLSQFLSPLVNTRTDEWGGSLENRARLLLEIVRAIRAEVSPGFSVAVKLNSADFQRGGFDADDARKVIDMLAPLGVDLVELSGGSYESPAMTGRPADDRTAAREAYFLELAAELAVSSPIPLMLTGGITRRQTAERVLVSGVAVVGIATALAETPDLPARWRHGAEATGRLKPVTWSDKPLASMASMAMVRYQCAGSARGRSPRWASGRRSRWSWINWYRGGRCGSTRDGWHRGRGWVLGPRFNGSGQETIMTNVLMVISAADRWTLNDGTVHPSGYWAEEVARPHQIFTQAGWHITVATPGGKAPTLDQLSLGISGGMPWKRKEVKSYLDSIANVLAHPVALDTVNADDYDVVFYPGGHGPMEDLAYDPVSGALLAHRLESGQPLALLCHAPAAILAAAGPDGASPFAGRRMTGLSNREEHLNSFGWKAPWLLEDKLKETGVDYSKALLPLRPHVVVDGNLYTGQNPQSSEKLAERLVADVKAGV